MEEEKVNKNNINKNSENKDEKEKQGSHKKNFKINIYDMQGENDIYYNPQRSYSCKVGEEKKKKFSYTSEEIKFDLNKKFKYLQTPQLKPKQGKLVINPLNIGTTSCTIKRKKLGLNDDNIILSEGEDVSNECSSDSDSDVNNETENLNINNIIKNKIENKENENYISNEIKAVNEFNIEEENDDNNFNEKGNLVLKNLRKNMILSKKIVKNSKNDKKIENIMKEKFNKIKENILNDPEEEETPKVLFKTIGFQKENTNLPILEFLRKNSSPISKKI